MVNLGKLAKTVKKVVDTKGDKIAAGVGKATDFVDKKTKGKFHDQLEKVDAAAEKLDKTTDRTADDPGSVAGPADTGPAGTRPADTGPADTGPTGTGPAGTGPADTGPAGTRPEDTGPAGTSGNA